MYLRLLVLIGKLRLPWYPAWRAVSRTRYVVHHLAMVQLAIKARTLLHLRSSVRQMRKKKYYLSEGHWLGNQSQCRIDSDLWTYNNHHRRWHLTVFVRRQALSFQNCFQGNVIKVGISAALCQFGIDDFSVGNGFQQVFRR